jgi:hypothetical protein
LGFTQELHERDAGNFDRILEAEEQPGRRAFMRFMREQVLPVKLTEPPVTS